MSAPKAILTNDHEPPPPPPTTPPQGSPIDSEPIWVLK